MSLLPSLPPAILVLADGTVFRGNAVGATGIASGEVVFNTAMAGYQETLTDPSYCRQIVAMTYPHIGNVGCNDEDFESRANFAAGLVIRDLPLRGENWRLRETLPEYLKKHGVTAIANIDTRRLTRHLREKGAQAGCLMAGEVDEGRALIEARAFPGLTGMDLLKEVSAGAPYEWDEGAWTLEGFLPAAGVKYHVVAYDYGVRRSVLRMLAARGCRVTVVPARTPAADVLKYDPDGIFLSNGPGDAAPCDYAVAAVRELLASGIPVCGICFGHQVLALASGAKTVKLKSGQHGANHPVRDLETGQVSITCQNHGFAVDAGSLPAHLRATHVSLFDGSLQGIARIDVPAFSFQGYPEVSPERYNMAHPFDRFISMMQARKAGRK